MKNQLEVRTYLDSFVQPSHLNEYAWNRAKSMALEVWDCYLAQRPLRKPINFFCNEFYKMIQKPNGELIVPENSFRRFAA